MRKRVRRVVLTLLAAASAGVALSACTTTFELDLQSFGNGIDGDLVATAWNAIDNECQPVLTIDSTLHLIAAPSTEWARPGRRVFLHQVTGSFTETGVANLTSDPGITGAWEIVEVAAVDGTAVTAAAPLARAYSWGPTKAAQACLVREYRALSLETSLRPAAAWSGSAGGVLVFFVSGVLSADTSEAVSVTGAGFPGGREAGVTHAVTGVGDYDTNENDGGFKGHGVDHRSRQLNGRGAYRNAAGSGNANRGAGGGGAGYGDGGAGEAGLSDTSGGFGGVAPDYVDEDFSPGRLFFGGGGGGGHAASSSTAGNGGFGGGLILGGAERVDGELLLLAHGMKGRNGVTGRGAGGGGGGGGGAVVFWTGRGTVLCRARGGGGGTGLGQGADGQGGVGGSGGGGACWVDGETDVSAVNSTSGEPGISGDPGPFPSWWNE